MFPCDQIPQGLPCAQRALIKSRVSHMQHLLLDQLFMETKRIKSFKKKTVTGIWET